MSTELIKYADDAMYPSEEMEKEIKVTIVNATRYPLSTLAAVCGIYEGIVHRDPYKLRFDNPELVQRAWDNVISSHLQAPLEFIKIHFLIEGVTRALTHQLVRQRTAVYAQESLRFAVKENAGTEAALPPSIAALPQNDDRRKNFEEALEVASETYLHLIGNGIPAEDARALLPHCTTTRLHYCTDMRNLIAHAGNRLCTQAQFEWRELFIKIVLAIKDHITVGSSDDIEWKYIANSDVFKPVCFKEQRCPFSAEWGQRLYNPRTCRLGSFR